MRAEDGDPRAVDEERDHRGARTAQIGVLCREIGEPRGGAVDGGTQHAEEIDVGEVLADQFGLGVQQRGDSDRAGHLAVGVATHPVGDDEQSRAGGGGVLVHLAATADVGTGCGAQRR